MELRDTRCTRIPKYGRFSKTIPVSLCTNLDPILPFVTKGSPEPFYIPLVAVQSRSLQHYRSGAIGYHPIATALFSIHKPQETSTEFQCQCNVPLSPPLIQHHNSCSCSTLSKPDLIPINPLRGPMMNAVNQDTTRRSMGLEHYIGL